MKIKKLTKQFRGYGLFKYCEEFSSLDITNFCQKRNWCWEQWGPSSELRICEKYDNHNKKWCWLFDDHRIRIYLGTDAEISWYSLKWG